MVSKVGQIDDEGSANRGETYCLFRDTIMKNYDAFMAEYNKKKADRDPKFKAIDDDFFDAFLGDDREQEMAESAWNGLGESGKKDFVALLEADPPLGDLVEGWKPEDQKKKK